MYKIDVKKWKAAVAEIEDFRVKADEVHKRIISKELDWLKAYQDPATRIFYGRDTNLELTRLYSIRAMARNRIHRKRARVAGEVVDLGWDDQLAFVGERWKEYERVVEQLA